jgi:hypothetical protein
VSQVELEVEVEVKRAPGGGGAPAEREGADVTQRQVSKVSQAELEVER